MANQEQSPNGAPKVGVTSDNQPDLVAPSGVNERDHVPPDAGLSNSNGPSDPDAKQH